VNRLRTSLLEKKTKSPVEAELLDGVAADLLERAENEWAATRLEAALQAHRSGRHVPEHWHWDWRKKSAKLNLLAYRCFALECRGGIQGLMMVSTATCVARLEPDKGKPLVYIDYLESAPWNVRELCEEPRFGGVGVRLFEAAVQFSKAEGFFGRVGLHSLPQSESFYEGTCRTTRLAPDQAAQGLVYFELTRKSAEEFLEGGTP